MKKQYVWIIVLVLVIIGVVFFVMRSKKLEAPATTTGQAMPAGDMGTMKASTIPADYNAPIPGDSTAPIKEFTVSGKNFSFDPSTITVNKGDVVKITFKNASGFHDFRIDEYKVATHQIKTGEEETVSFVADKTGSFQYYCSVGSHRALGMWGTLIVQ